MRSESFNVTLVGKYPRAYRNSLRVGVLNRGLEEFTAVLTAVFESLDSLSKVDAQALALGVRRDTDVSGSSLGIGDVKALSGEHNDLISSLTRTRAVETRINNVATSGGALAVAVTKTNLRKTTRPLEKDIKLGDSINVHWDLGDNVVSNNGSTLRVNDITKETLDDSSAEDAGLNITSTLEFLNIDDGNVINNDRVCEGKLHYSTAGAVVGLGFRKTLLDDKDIAKGLSVGEGGKVGLGVVQTGTTGSRKVVGRTEVSIMAPGIGGVEDGEFVVNESTSQSTDLSRDAERSRGKYR